jgi:hypothetical protein
MSKLEKPAAIEHLEHIVELSDSVMVARGVPAPKERGGKHTVKKSISPTLLEFNVFVSIRSGLVRNPG